MKQLLIKLIIPTIALLIVLFVGGQVALASSACVISADDSMGGRYSYGDTITLHWTSESWVTSASFKKDTSGKDTLSLPGDKLSANGSQVITANVVGNSTVTLLVEGFSDTGAKISGSCSVTIEILALSDNSNDGLYSSQGDSALGKNLQKPEIKIWLQYLDSGGSSLNWETKYAKRCVLKNGSSEENVVTNGSKLLSLGQGAFYSLWCANDDGTGKDGPSTLSTSIYVGPSSGGNAIDSSDINQASVAQQIAALQKLLLSLLQQLVALLSAQL